MDRVTKQFGLNQTAIGVADGNQLERIVFSKDLIAGIRFHHTNVSSQDR